MSDLRRQGRLAALLRKRSRCRGRRIKSRMPAPKPTPFIAPPGTLGHACGLRRGASGENDVPSRGGTSSCTASGPGSHRRNRNRPRRAANRLRSTLCGPRSLASCCIAGLLRKSPDEQGCKANSRQNIARPAARRPIRACADSKNWRWKIGSGRSGLVSNRRSCSRGSHRAGVAAARLAVGGCSFFQPERAPAGQH